MNFFSHQYSSWTLLKGIFKSIFFLILVVTELQAATYYTRATGDWNVSSTWSTVGCNNATNAGTFPVAGDIVNICSGHTVTMTVNANCQELTILNGGVLTTSNYFILTVSNNMDVQNGGSINLDGKGSGGASGGSPGASTTCSGTTLGSAGGGYGGNGGNGGKGALGGTTNYGSITAPVSLGSGGGTGCSAGGSGGGALKLLVTNTLTVNGNVSANGSDGASYAGGGSGGSLWIVVNVLAGATGEISVNGGAGYAGSYYGGGGGGGRIAYYYTVNTYAGDITAYGGNAGSTAEKGGAGTIYEKSATSNGNLKIVNNGATNVLTPLDLTTVITYNSVNSSGNANLYLTGTQTSVITDLNISSNSTIIGTTTDLTIGNDYLLAGTMVYPLLTRLEVGNDYVIALGATMTTVVLTTLTVDHDLSVLGTSSMDVVATLTIGNNLSVSGTMTLPTGSLTTTTDVANNLIVPFGGTITGSSLVFNVLNNMDVQNGGSINLDGKGSGGASGGSPGASTTCSGTTLGSAGGGYGGNGGNGGKGALGGTTNYGSITAPVSLGSGGGTGCSAGGSGGGALKLLVTNTLTVNGNVSANGSDGASYAGGGSGGSLWIVVNVLAGATGEISVNGGAGYAGSYYGGGGGGGRIAYYYTVNTYAGDITAYGGNAGSTAEKGGAGTIFSYDGTNDVAVLDVINGGSSGANTLLDMTEVVTYNTVSVSGNAHLYLTGVQTRRIDNLTIDASSSIAGTTTDFKVNIDFVLNGTMNWPTLALLSVGRDYTIASGASVTTPSLTTLNVNNDLVASGPISSVSLTAINVNNDFNLLSTLDVGMSSLTTIVNNDLVVSGTISGSSLVFNASNNMDVQSGGSINLDGKGSIGASGGSPGASTTCSGTTLGSAGGGYGGNGGNGGKGALGGTTNYGSITAPVSLGSGGGTGCSAGGSGGGALKLLVTNTLTVNGNLSANGLDGASYAGGGSGGSIWFSASTITGITGVISANGGTGYAGSYYGGGGGGGRMAYYYDNITYGGSITVDGGSAGGAAIAGSVGTIHSNSPVSICSCPPDSYIPVTVIGITPAIPPCGVITPVVPDKPLPVIWLSFDALPGSSPNGSKYYDVYTQGANVKIEWATASEVNNNYFVVERSKNAIHFEEVGTVQGAGNSNSIRNYELYDRKPYIGTSYYRIKQVDFNGDYFYSSVQVVYIKPKTILNVFPNPSTDNIELVLSNEEPADLEVVMLDLYGRVVFRIALKVNKGIVKKRIHHTSIAKGTYILKIKNGEEEYVQKQVLL